MYPVPTPMIETKKYCSIVISVDLYGSGCCGVVCQKSVHSLAKEGKVTSKKVRNKEERFEERPFTYLELLNNAKVKSHPDR